MVMIISWYVRKRGEKDEKESIGESSGKKEDYKNKVRGVKQMNHRHYF